MLRTFLNIFITQETPLLSGWCFYAKMLSCFFNFLQTTSAAYGYYPYLFSFLLPSIHHMVWIRSVASFLAPFFGIPIRQLWN